MLPLDLHVLGLSLAFILSQDQTLRCYILIKKNFFSNSERCFIGVLKNDWELRKLTLR